MAETIDFILAVIFWWVVVCFGITALYVFFMYMYKRNKFDYPEMPPYLSPEEHDEFYRSLRNNNE